jgi:hypothetical protein
MNLEEKIRKKMEEEKITIEYIEHEPVFTNPTMALALGVKNLKQ